MGSLVPVVVFLFPNVPDSTNNLKSQIWPTITTSPTHLDGRYQLLLPSAYYQLSNLKWMVKIEWNVLSSGATFYSISFSFLFFSFRFLFFYKQFQLMAFTFNKISKH